jgi:hypothetical protein
MQEFQVLRVLEPALRMKAQVDSSSRGRKYLICREEKRKTAWWGLHVVPCVRDLFCVLPEGRDVFQVYTGIFWEGEVSP